MVAGFLDFVAGLVGGDADFFEVLDLTVFFLPFGETLVAIEVLVFFFSGVLLVLVTGVEGTGGFSRDATFSFSL